jgi:hypothetical protein
VHESAIGIKETADLASAGLHALGETLARQVLRFHRLGDLPSQHFLDGDGLEFFELPFFLKEFVDAAGQRSWAVPMHNACTIYCASFRQDPGCNCSVFFPSHRHST